MITIVRVGPRRAALVSLGFALAVGPACGKHPGQEGKPAASAAAAAMTSAEVPAAASASAMASATVSASAMASAAAAGTAAVKSNADDGAGDCRVVRGPVRLGTTGAVAIGTGEGGLIGFATNKTGAPSWELPRFPEPVKQGPVLLPKPGPAATVPALVTSAASVASVAGSAASGAPVEERTRLPACALAGGFAYCADADGAIHKRPASADGDTIVAKGRRGTPVSAVVQGGHTYYAFLANQKTSEGIIVQAFVAVDDEAPIVLSEDGSGATFVGLVARERDVLAMYIDARTALTPIHARTLRREDRLLRGADAVVFVGGGADGHVRGALGRGASGPAFLFVPGAHDEQGYGVVTLAIEGEPKDDLPGKWSLYPDAIDSPALAATTGKSPLRLVRSRPESKDSTSPQVLELGHVESDGTFREKCVLAKAAAFADASIAVDDKGSLWIAYTTAAGTWVEQRGPAGR